MYPKLEDVVMVNVRSIAEMGTYVNLLEYNNIEGMIMLSELTRRRIRSINKLVRIGRNECVAVIRVDEEKGVEAVVESHDSHMTSQGTLICPREGSRKRKFKVVRRSSLVPRRLVASGVYDTVLTCTEQVNSILCNVARQMDYDNEKLEDLYNRTAWHFEDTKGVGSAYDVFKKVVRCVALSSV